MSYATYFMTSCLGACFRSVCQLWSQLILTTIEKYASLRIKCLSLEKPFGYTGNVAIKLCQGRRPIKGFNVESKLTEVLFTYRSITAVDLDGFKIGSYGVKSIAKVMCTNRSLTSLALNGNGIGRCGTVLADALRASSSLTRLKLSCNKIDRDGAFAIAAALSSNSSLVSLDLASNRIAVEEATALAEMLCTNHSITHLSLSGNKLRCEGAEARAKALKVNTSLTSLLLHTCSFGPSGAQALAKALRVNASILTLDLYSNNIGCTGARALAGALQVNSTLTNLSLEYNCIENSGAIALSDALSVNCSLRTLALRCNQIRKTCMTHIIDTQRSRSVFTAILFDSEVNYDHLYLYDSDYDDYEFACDSDAFRRSYDHFRDNSYGSNYNS
jgi:Ran GTPase-activating protein (RanGAP) involved in mRNA processing and transport